MWRLNHTIQSDSPCWQCRPSFELITCAEGHGWLVHELQAPLAAGTHIDAPKHCRGRLTVESFPEAEWVRAYVFRPSNVTPTTVILRSQLQDWWDALERPATQGSWLFIQTGWGAYFSDGARYRGVGPLPGEYPHLEGACADWILERGFVGLGVDTLCPDSNASFPIHEALLPSNCWILENLRYEPDLPEICEVLVAPIRWTGATETSTVVLARATADDR
ncbi:MAG: cyclase family protein [Chlamydiia bacterium]